MFEHNLYIDIDRPGGLPCLLDGKASSLLQSEPQMVHADQFPLNVYFRRRGSAGAASTAVDLGAGKTLILAGKKSAVLATGETLFSAAGFEAAGEGDDLHYTADLNLNTGALATALGTENTLPVRVDIEIQTAGNAQRITYQFNLTISRQVYAGEPAPDEALPPYPHPSAIVTKLRGTVDLTEDDGGVTVTGLALGAVPAQVLLSLRIPSAGASLIPLALVGTPTADGFDVIFGAKIPAAGYTLDYLVIL